jgi:hypothetical protein
MKTCRSLSPSLGDTIARQPCIKERGHKGKHSNPLIKKKWTGGINTEARWEFIDDGYMNEAYRATWGRMF